MPTRHFVVGDTRFLLPVLDIELVSALWPTLLSNRHRHIRLGNGLFHLPMERFAVERHTLHLM